jgi:SAM-dependent methyltransferase
LQDDSMSWRDFWNGEHAIYVNERHRLLHANRMARDIARLMPSPEAHVLDHGCGEALAAPEIADRCGRLYLCDAAPSIRERLRLRLSRHPRIAVLAPDDIGDTLPDASLDLVLAISVVQYLSRRELEDCLALWRLKLKPSGQLVIADVIPPGVGAVSDAAALLRFGFQGGFMIASFAGLARTYFSKYRRLRQDLGLAQYGEAEIVSLLGDASFRAERHFPNIGHNQARMTFIARPAIG